MVVTPKQLSFADAPTTAEKPIPDPGSDYGEVFTRRWVVELILDLVGYTADRDLASQVVIEPACGTGAFLGPIADRLIASSRRHGHDLGSLQRAVRAFEVLDANAARARKTVAAQLQEAGLSDGAAADVARAWVTTGDFLLHDHPPRSVDYVVGNPPYVRLESVSRATMEAYRRACPTMRGRADLYVGFLERGLELLGDGGSLGFICADRWMHNQYGADLRGLVSGSYAIDAVIAMHDVDAFESDVSAYPAIVVVRNGAKRRTLVADTGRGFQEDDARKISAWGRKASTTEPESDMHTANVDASTVETWFQGRDLWPSGTPAQLALVADLERRFPPLEDPRTGTRVGIGVATGCDDVYITRDADAVEGDRLLPLLRSGDTKTGVPAWSGTYLVNPWVGGALADLAHFPRMGGYFEAHEKRLRSRHIAKRRPAEWYRTIDRVDPDLLARPKLVFPDIKALSHPVLDEGQFYPHHNLYHVVSDAWDPEVLGGILLSGVANLFVGAYCVKMRGSCYRFQAQYLRRIRVPERASISARDRRTLASAFAARDIDRATAICAPLYGIEDPTAIR